MATIDSLVVRHTFAIDASTTYPTNDKYRFAGNFYSDKPPALALAGAGIALGLQPFHVSIERTPHLAYYFITLLSVGLAYASGLTALYATLRLTAGVTWSACITIVAGTGTLLLPYATILNNHVVSGALLAIGFRLLVAPKPNRWTIALGGASLALAASIDISFTIFLALAPLLLVRHGMRRALVPFALAALPIVALYLAANLALSGNVIPPAVNLPLWQYPGSQFDSHNLTGLATHRSLGQHLRYAVDLLVGSHGLFTYMPILFVSLYALVAEWRARSRHRLELLFIGLGAALYVASYAWSSSDYSGFAYGIRWYAGIVFLIMVPLGYLEPALERSREFRGLFVLAAFASCLMATIGVIDPSTSSDSGIAPFIVNARLLLSGHHAFVKAAASAAFVVAITALIGRLVVSLPRTHERTA